MKASLTKSFVSGFLSTVLVMGIGSAMAAEHLSEKISAALAKKDLTEIEKLLKSGPGNVDEVIKNLLKSTQSTMGADPAFAGKMMSVAGQYAPQITPPTVPAVCADMRRIVAALKPEQNGTELFKSVMVASENFSKAPVVVAAGRPNECEQAWLQISNLAGEEALLAQMPGMRGPGLPPTTIRPGVPPTTPPETEKPSAD